MTVALDFTPDGWSLDLDRLLAALTAQTRMLIINSPANPTGWTMDRHAQAAVLAHCRRHGIWILSDDAYERLYFGEAGAAPSFLDLAGPDDRVVSANTFSKSWLMTGWRLGWICAPAGLVNDLGTLVEYNTSCAPGFVQRAGLVALTQGDAVIARTRASLRAARDFLIPALAALDGVRVAPPQGAMYAFFGVQGVTDSLEFCKRLVVDAGLGLAPGSAFGPEGEGYIRWCFATGIPRLEAGLARLAAALRTVHS